ncbi:FAD-dependent oxidoreductase [Methylovirgula sp. 4M-Z18]|uniref:FAD-dependent oxidoreductase n=1 Tax=Methylovirgula sp. 4M-Z18 TaxID=2293567 RepID=UPI000E2FC0C1|nr:FAD-dependent oxidoreductase [Methylovirgula sp. 4M-Z18]RFB76523.1 FAD-dependent oxidoreductase [Methylovirgula sp. 4M-Z18]
MMDNGFSDLAKSPFDVLIIGAGINGCSTARELSRLGYSVLLADRGDLGGATTARSGRVLHCGLQLLAPKRSLVDYLADPLDLVMRLRSARRAARDFEEFCRQPPRQLEPMTTFVPIFHDSPYSGWQVDLGAKVIRMFVGNGANFQYRRWGLNESRSNPFVPDLGKRETLRSLISFRDFRFCWPERIAIDAALAAERNGTRLLSFTNVSDLSRAPAGRWHARLVQVRDGDREMEVSARIVLNLAGARVDDVIASANPTSVIAKKVVAVKGVYLLVKLPARYHGLGLAGTNSVGEPICCLPWIDLHYIGPTETPFTGALADVRPEEEDIDFLLAEMRRFAPGLAITRSNVVMAWAGVRPITTQKGYPKGKRLPFNTIHDLALEGLPNMLALSWGIVANHRSTARALAKAVSSKIPRSRPVQAQWSGHIALPGTGRRLQDDYSATDDDVRFCVEHEHAKDLSGVLFSRIGLGWTGHMTAEAVRVAATTMAPLLSWSRSRTQDELDKFKTKLKVDHCYELV